MRKTWSVTIVILMLVFVLCGCKSAEVTAQSLLGEYADNQYINKALGFTATAPDGWVFATAEEIEQLTGQASDLVESVSDVSPESAITLMFCSQTELDPNGANNNNINITFSNQQSVLAILSAEAALEQLVGDLQSTYSELYAQIFPDSVVTTSGERVTINDRKYAAVHTQMVFGDITMQQSQYFTQMGKGSLVVTVTSFDESGKEAGGTFMKELVFD